jgi:hypothetical protein
MATFRGSGTPKNAICWKPSFREHHLAEAQFPGRTLLGSWVNKGNLPTPWGRGSSPARRDGLRDHPGQQLRMREHRVVAGR